MKTKITTDERIRMVLALPSHLLFALMDDRLLAVPLDWYPRLRAASPEQLNHWEIRGGGFVVRWPELDEDLEISGLLAGNPAPELRSTGEIAGERIHDFRETSGISQGELAEQLGVRQATISDWEKGKTSPSPLAATRLRELIRKHELSAQSRQLRGVHFNAQSLVTEGINHWFGCFLPNGMMEEQCSGIAEESQGNAEYRFTELNLVQAAPERRSLLYCARFNPPRQFLHSCSYQTVK
jgi:transcriptional regulator with XRE-family HTH domain